jgi:hypothetical protein
MSMRERIMMDDMISVASYPVSTEDMIFQGSKNGKPMNLGKIGLALAKHIAEYSDVLRTDYFTPDSFSLIEDSKEESR